MSTKTVLITGCGQGGIGEALASKFRAAGCEVIATHLPFETHEHLDALGCHRRILDVTKQESVDELATYVEKVFAGRLDVLVNNAGICYTMTAIDTDVTQVEKMFNVNVFGPMRMVREFHPFLIKGKGTIVNIGSVGGIVPYTFGASYNATKAGLVHWGSTLRVELAPLGVKVVNVISGNIGTNILKSDANAKRTIPEDSFYKPLSKEFEDHVNRPAGATDRFEYAAAVVAETLKKKPKAFFWYGDTTWTVWLLNTFGWATIWDSFLWGMFNMHKLASVYK